MSCSFHMLKRSAHKPSFALLLQVSQAEGNSSLAGQLPSYQPIHSHACSTPVVALKRRVS